MSTVCYSIIPDVKCTIQSQISRALIHSIQIKTFQQVSDLTNGGGKTDTAAKPLLEETIALKVVPERT